MRSSFAKSIYFGAAVLGLAGLSAVTTTTASAKSSAAKVTSSKALTTDATTRNVNFTGTNALYSKPGTVKGAKVVATTTTAKRLAASKNGQNNVRAYRVATTNRGSVYYKVVTFDRAYRGWIYGGKATDKFAGGINSFATTTDAKIPSTLSTSSYYTLAKTDATVNDGTTTTYKAPAWSQYKVGRTMKDASAYKTNLLQVSKAATTRDGATWVYVTDVTNGKLTGWVKASALKSSTDVPASEGVTINYTDKATGKVVKSAVIPFKADNAALANPTMNVWTDKNAANKLVHANMPAGYSVSANAWGSEAAAKAATKGSSLVFYVTENAKKAVTINNSLEIGDDGATKTLVFSGKALTQWNAAKAAFAKDSTVTDLQGKAIDSSVLKTALKNAGFDTITADDGTVYTLNTSVLPSNVAFGQNINLTYSK
ncbi:hypothetical protein CCS05_12790 (plasmid) [Levilactobacillus brevis]|uniref:GW dipeptide domain-containing protein n=1 Tax=Levilactobacillus brevis TaxID=1580 RepID=UPI000D73464E|nr:GW dipeptide domain-containing protein [Levilactobacillus brevis]AWP47792.1 hypothetical protein CCS05_12790 [Levilactobacillus brevis]